MSSEQAFEAPRAGRLEFTSDELLAEAAYDEPLDAAGIRCHGGFVAGRYQSPRALYRGPAIASWQARLREEGEPLLHLPTEYVPPHYPNYPQAKLLLQEGIEPPIARALTIISIVEGFGARIREVRLPDLHRSIKEDLAGTALAHLEGGLFEAHARDEAGHRDQGGHKQMWEAARDLGLDKPEIPDDVLMRMMMRGSRPPRRRVFPELSPRLEDAITFMASVMVLEIFAEDVFEWAKHLLGDPEVSADPVGAAAMVANIQADEKPHVEYLRTALSELRARTLIGEDGKTELRGAEVIDRIFESSLREAATRRPQNEREDLRREIREAISDGPRASEIARTFESLDSGWVFPAPDDERLDLLLESA